MTEPDGQRLLLSDWLMLCRQPPLIGQVACCDVRNDGEMMNEP